MHLLARHTAQHPRELGGVEEGEHLVFSFWGLRVEGLELRVEGSGSRVWGLGFRVWDLGFRV